MELFKLFGTIAINNTKAKEGLHEVTKEAKKTENGLEEVGDEAKKSEGKLEKFGTVAGKLGTTILKGTAVALTAVASAIGAVGASAIKYNAEMESYSTSFEVMTGSAEKATEVMEKLKELGAKTPFEFTDLASATQLLMNYGFTADDAMSKMMMLGDISQGNADKMQRVAMAYGQMSSAGKVSLEDIKQMIEAGFNPLQEISTATGESMESLYDRISKGTISVDEITASMERSTSIGGKYYQSMDKQSKTLAGRFSTLKDTFQQMTGTIFSGVSEMLASDALPMIIAWVEQLATIYEKEGKDAFIKAVGNVFGAILKHITKAIPDFVKMGFQLLNGILNGITENKEEIASAVVTLVTTLLEEFANFLVDFIDTGLQIVVSLIEGITEKLPSLIQTITNLVLDLVDVLLDNLPLFLNAGLQFIVKLAEGILQALPDLLSKLPAIVQKIASTLLDNIEMIIQAGVQLLTALVDNLPLIIQTIVAVLPQIITAIISTLLSEDGISSIVQAGVDLLTSLIDNMDEIILTIVSAIPALISGILGAIVNTDNLGSLASAGASIIGSLLSGMQSAWETVTGWVNSACNWLNGKLQELGIGGYSGGVIEGITSATNAFTKGTSTMNRTSGSSGSAKGTGSTGNKGNTQGTMKPVGQYADGGVIPKGHIAFLEGYGAEAVVPLEKTAWIDKVAQNMDSALGGNGTSQKLDRLIALQEQMLAIMPELANISISLNNREFGRAVRQVNA